MFLLSIFFSGFSDLTGPVKTPTGIDRGSWWVETQLRFGLLPTITQYWRLVLSRCILILTCME